ncbi:protein GRIM REAPER [Vigna unguiculata]|uniref:Stigma-specific protein Stig1 n=1 Tax=Vigna unguiculata TaxID=3917 RepID=A0A4D6N7X7_VIGUN|nr:protein GRIM REAPER [Vigna unguiculata]QCE09953.1 Stigma-specific protein Stig1 [Vigna unguiculata]
MANTILKLTAFLVLLIFSTLHDSHFASATDVQDQNHNEEEDEDYVLDTPITHSGPRSRFLVSVIKKGRQCNAESNNICNGVRANKGRDLLYCCKTHCRNVLRDKNNCKVCGNKCKQGERCCNGVCTNVLSNANHCGKCDKKCSSGDSCGNGVCGYA